MQPVWLCIFSRREFEEAFENAQWRKVKQMQPMWIFILLCKRFEDTFEKTQNTEVKSQTNATNANKHALRATFEIPWWRKNKQMQPMWFCILWRKSLKGTLENTHIVHLFVSRPLDISLLLVACYLLLLWPTNQRGARDVIAIASIKESIQLFGKKDENTTS